MYLPINKTQGRVQTSATFQVFLVNYENNYEKLLPYKCFQENKSVPIEAGSQNDFLKVSYQTYK